MSPHSRRRILPTENLGAFSAVPIYPSFSGGAEAVGQDNTDQLISSSSTPTVRCTTTNEEIILPIGIRIGGWKIITQNSSIGDEKKMDDLTVLLEDTANDTSNINMTDAKNTRRKRRLCPPEITFSDAIISFQYETKRNSNEEEGMATNCIRFTAQDALLEWAEAHTKLQQTQSSAKTTTPVVASRDEYRGVSIITTADAKIWTNRQQPSQNVDSTDNNTSSDIKSGTSSQFYYDWTFSSPYAGTIIHQSKHSNTCTGDEKNIGEVNDFNNRKLWQPLQQSHIPFHLLQDTTQPILLYDDIHLYEDDLHDNGDVSLNIKVRVMPKCWYVLQRLYVRVDHVCVKCREVRYFCLFNDNNVGVSRSEVQVNTIYRDIVWREATWEQLSRLALPTDPAAWRESDGNAGALNSLLARLPSVSLPNDLPTHSYFYAAKAK